MVRAIYWGSFIVKHMTDTTIIAVRYDGICKHADYLIRILLVCKITSRFSHLHSRRLPVSYNASVARNCTSKESWKLGWLTRNLEHRYMTLPLMIFNVELLIYIRNTISANILSNQTHILRQLPTTCVPFRITTSIFYNGKEHAGRSHVHYGGRWFPTS